MRETRRRLALPMSIAVIVALLWLSACGPKRGTEVASSPGAPANPATVTPAASTMPVPSLEPVANWMPKVGEPLRELPGVWAKDGVLAVKLDAKEGLASVAGSPLTVRGYNGSLIGPTLHVGLGDTIDVTLVNDTDRMTNIHYHGLHVSPSDISDNVLRTMEPGTVNESVVHIPADHETGLFWYHAHMHGNTEPAVAGGMSGLLVIGDIVATHLPTEFQDIAEHDIAVRDVQYDGDRVTFNEDPTADATRMLNGQFQPTMTIAPGETQLWKFANIGSGFFYDLSLEGHTFHVISEDASPVWEVWDADHLVLPPGKRYEVLVQGGEAGTYDLKTLKYDQGFQFLPNAKLATVTVEGAAVQPLSIPTALLGPMTTELTDATIAQNRKFVFTIDVPKHPTADNPVTFRINNEVFDPNVVNVSPQLGTVEEWTLVNHSGEQHPFHIHVNDFQVMSVNGRPYDAKGLQDVVPIPAYGSVVIRNPFDDFTGSYVFHCHILDHEDGGMMQIVDVVDEAGAADPAAP